MSEDYTNTMDNEFTANIEQIGASSNPFQHQTEALKARIFHGASRVEFSFFGAGKTNKEQPGPESFGRREREDMRDLAEINKIETSTHATVNINGLSGFDGQNGFSSEKQSASMNELKKAIDFASEASTGGAIVFHTGDGPRSMWSNFDKKGEFQLHHKEDKEEIHYLVDPYDKKIVGGVKEDAYMFLPVQDEIYDEQTKKMEKVWMKNEDGSVLKDEILGIPIPVYKTDDKGEIITKKITFEGWKNGEGKEFAKERINQLTKKGEDPSKLNEDQEIIKGFYWKQQESQILYQVGQARMYLDNYNEGLKSRDKIKDALKYYRDLKEKLPEDEWERNFNNIPERYDGAGLTIPDNKDPVEYLKEQLLKNERQIAYGRDIAVSGFAQAKDVYEKFQRVEMIQDYALNQATNQMAEAAIYAYKKTQQRIEKGDEFIKKNPLYISPEGVRPEEYGSHPDEIKKMVQESRQKVIDELKNTHGEVKARKIANQSIKATIDIGHVNTWKKFYVKKQGESEENFDKRFKNWVLTKTEDLASKGIIGHVHLSDNFGYDDEHLTIGDGNAPVKEFVNIMRKNGVKEFIVEGGSFNPMTALPDSWSELGSPIYRVGSPSAGSSMDTWGNFHQGYFGETEGPRYVVGEYSPSEDFKGSPFYSGTPLE